MTAGSLSFRDVRVRRSRRTILDVAGLEIPPGAFVGVVGANGAGKTTLLKLCAGLIKPTEGHVAVDGQNPAHFNPWRRCHLRKRIGYVPQSAEYNAELPFTLREVVAMGRTSVRPLLTRLNEEDHATVDLWIEQLGLSNHADQTFRSLSGGEQRKTLIARAMAQNPDILMLDEPCANLDFNWKYQLSEIIERLYRRTKVTVLMVSHEPNVLPPACDRILLLSEGRIVADGDAETVLSPETLACAYDGTFQTFTVEGRRHMVNVVASAAGRDRNEPRNRNR
ncbi:MAG: ABC transporter ATP-binding protein [Sedimentisphaerales bacterium]|nr:ABC transporter ATP-binding protein [Sedimentisphaerales bacterium]